MATGTVKWFNSQKGYGFSFSPKTAAARMYSSTFPRLRRLASAVSTRGRLSNTKRSRIRAKRRPKISKSSDLALRGPNEKTPPSFRRRGLVAHLASQAVTRALQLKQ